MINKHGNSILACEYDLLGDFSENRIMIVKELKYGFADRHGRIVIPLDFEYSNRLIAPPYFINGFAVAEKKQMQGLIDTTGKYITAKNFERIDVFSEGLAAIQKKEKWGYLNSSAKVQIPYTYETAGYFKNNLARVTKKGKIGFINKEGKVVIDFLYDEATNFDMFERPWSLVTKNNKKGIIDEIGREIISCEMDDIKSEEMNLLKVEKKSKIAYFDMKKKSFLWKEEGF